MISCGRPDVRWKDGVHKSFETSTGVFLKTQTYESLVEFIKQGCKADKYAFVCLDAPGMGKTTTVARAAADTGALHVVLQGGTGIMDSTVNKLFDLFKDAAVDGLIDGITACTIALRAWKVAFMKVVDKIIVRLRAKPNQQIYLLDGNGANWALLDGSDIDGLVEAAKSQLAAVMTECWHGAQRIIIHIDEIQSLLDPAFCSPVDGHMPSRPCSPLAAMGYMHVWCTQALMKVCSDFPYKLCITGISSSANNSIHLAHGLKIWGNPPLPYFSKALTKRLLKEVLIFDDETVCDQLVAGCHGCPRAVQYVLLLLREAEEPWEVKCLLEKAQGRWIRAAHNCFMKGTEENATTALEILFATMFPHLCGGEPHNDGEVHGAIFDDGIKTSWMEASKCGVVRVRQGDRGLFVFPPYPFLEAYLRRLAPRFLLPADCISLVRNAHVFPKEEGCRGRGKVFEFAFALEACLPTSPLRSAIAKQIHEAGGPKLIPTGFGISYIRHVESTAELVANIEADKTSYVPHVHRVLDQGHVAIPFLNNEAPTEAVIDIKASHTESLDYIYRELVKFVEWCRSECAKPFPWACYVTNRNLQDPKVCKAMETLNEYNQANKGERCVGLLVLTDELLDACSINLRVALHVEEYADGEWCELLFRGSKTRKLLYEHEAKEMNRKASLLHENILGSAVDAAASLVSRMEAMSITEMRCVLYNSKRQRVTIEFRARFGMIEDVLLAVERSGLPPAWEIDHTACNLYPIIDLSAWVYDEIIKSPPAEPHQTLASIFSPGRTKVCFVVAPLLA